ncbi:MAG: dihydropteroate synthase [Treponematales bacterium]
MMAGECVAVTARRLALPSGGVLDLTGRPLVMAVVNCTPDSFFPESRAGGAAEAAERALRAGEDGADIIDFGAESTRPGAAYVSREEEAARLIPAIAAFRKRSPLPVSVDTRKAAVAAAALDAGADIINDISALEDDAGMGKLCAARNAPVILMHKKGVPAAMQDKPEYRDAAAEVRAYLARAAERAAACGIDANSVILDPGIGFGKTLADNLALLAALPRLASLGHPLLVGLSRKTFIGELTGRDVSHRLAGTLAAHAVSVLLGADIIRAHDVRETLDAVKVAWAIKRGGSGKDAD